MPRDLRHDFAAGVAPTVHRPNGRRSKSELSFEIRTAARGRSEAGARGKCTQAPIRRRGGTVRCASRVAGWGPASYRMTVPEGPRSPDETDRERAATVLAPRGTGAYQPGQLIVGRYRLERKLAVGGMGEIWVAANVALGQEVALKLVRRNARSAAGAERLLREACTAARLRPRAIVQVFDLGVTAENDPFLVMELLQGKDAGELVRRAGPLDAVQAAQLMIPVLSGLGAAHALGIVHRDLKPENIFLADLDGGRVQPKIVDFGIARVVVPSSAMKLTSAGMMIGTPEFMAPEQIESLDDIDGRADLWAFGITMYCLIAGAVPFAGADVHALFEAILDGHVPFPTQAKKLDGELWRILTDALRRDRAERWQTAEEMETALTSWLLAQGVSEDMSGRTLRVASMDLRTHSTVPELASRPPDVVAAPPSAPPSSTPSSSAGPASLDQAIFSRLKKRNP